MPFDLTNALATFQALMNELFKPYLRKIVLVFFYDILIYIYNWHDHVQHVKAVFQILLQNQLYAMKSKCKFGVAEVEYLGCIVFASGVTVDKKKIQAVLEWHVPRILKALRGFFWG